MNNEVRDGFGNVIGYRCSICYGIFPKMWGTICNRCRNSKGLT